MHPNLQKFINHLHTKGYPVKIEDRCSNDSWTYNGDSIARNVSPTIPYTDHNILHEIGHWIISSDEQKLFPEYGLKFGAVDDEAFGERGGEFKFENGIKKKFAIDKLDYGLVDLEDQNFQELFAQQFSIFYGPKLNINPQIHLIQRYTEANQIVDWKLYEKEKTYDLKVRGFERRVYSAMLNLSVRIEYGKFLYV